MLKSMNLTKENNLKKQRVIRRIFVSGVLGTFILATICCLQVHRINSYNFKEPPSTLDKQIGVMSDFINGKTEIDTATHKSINDDDDFNRLVSISG